MALPSKLNKDCAGQILQIQTSSLPVLGWSLAGQCLSRLALLLVVHFAWAKPAQATASAPRTFVGSLRAQVCLATCRPDQHRRLDWDMSTVKERERQAEDRQQVKDQCTAEAATAGFKAAGMALVAAGVAVGAANQYAPGFRRALGISGKTALVVSPAFFMFFLQSELQMHDCTRRRRREEAGITESAESFRGW